MTSTISSWGNSQALRVPKDILEELNLHVGDKVDILVRDKEMIIKPKRKKYKIEDLVAQMPKDYKPEPEVFSDSIGLEVW
ncbi:MAG: AbrB/MazE/SpoVT family DNA-binding domain-containing protein [Campylobacteraceae bacterium]|nr:AbrB/MazE/SpoVT family DNA-binding domain-containing protein [Campylobacteraceae bacterium]